MTIRMNHVASKHQLKHMSATVYKMEDGTEVLKSYDTIVAMRLPDGNFAFSAYWTSKAGSATTKRHISTWCGAHITSIRDDLKHHWYMELHDINKDYLRAIEVATGGRID